jgi:hypothetical protein
VVVGLRAGLGAHARPGDVAHLRPVEAALGGERAFGPRLSVTPRHRPCPDAPAPLPVSSCPLPAPLAAPDARVLARTARAAAEVRGRVDGAALHRTALLDLLWSGAGGSSLERSISSLERAARLEARPGAALGDLAAAYLLRAERDGAPRDLLLALEAAERALEAAPGDLAAGWNRALALERLGLAEGAGAAWEAYAAGDGRSGWGAEARERARGAVPPPPPAAPEGPDAAAAERFAASAPGEARAWGMERALGGWAAAALAGDGEGAERWLAAAEAAGGRLARDGRDRSLADAARAVRESAGEDRVRLARAHAAFAEAAGRFGEGRHAEAGAPLDAARDAAAGSPALAGWAAVERAAAHG